MYKMNYKCENEWVQASRRDGETSNNEEKVHGQPADWLTDCLLL